MTATPKNTQNDPIPGDFPISTTYPLQQYWYEIKRVEQGILVVLSAIPAQLSVNSELTLFSYMEFSLSYTSTSTDVTLSDVFLTEGQPIEVNQKSLPLSIQVINTQSQNVNIALEVVDPSGISLDSKNLLFPLTAACMM